MLIPVYSDSDSEFSRNMQLGNDLGIRQSNAWLLAYRTRQGWAGTASELFGRTVKMDEVYIGCKENNKHNDSKSSRGEFCDRYNVHHIDTMDQIGSTTHGLMEAKKLTYKEFVSG